MQPNPPCVRQAWLDLYGDGTVTVALDDPSAGWVCQQLDLGYPTPREVLTNWPNQDGADDRTALMGPRVVTADITALVGAGARIDAAASAFAPYMAPANRPVLHYILDRPGLAERTITLRGSGYSWPIVGANQRDLQLQWTAANPLILDPTVQTATATISAGAQIVTAGTVAIKPNLAIYGPVTAPAVTVDPPGPNVFTIKFLAGFVIAAGHYVSVNTTTKTALLDNNPASSVANQIDWQNTTWPVVPPNTSATAATLTLTGTSTTGATQVRATWQDAYLT
ncbi:MAG TPA: hypothetical protein VGH66_13975 [Acidimicrobiales bacterium]|jgi:hypothetical protein